MNWWKRQREAVGKAKGKRVTQREIGDALGYTDKLIGMWETDASTPDIARTPSLARIYMVTEEEIRTQIERTAKRVESIRERKKAIASK